MVGVGLNDTSRNQAPLLSLALWCGVALLVTVGVAAALGRGVFLADLATRAEPFRQRALLALQRRDPFVRQRAAELSLVDRRFAAHRLATLLHIVPGAVFLVLAPLQFSARIRSRHIQFHRWSGRFLVSAGIVTGVAGLYFGLLMPYAGPGEAAAIAVFGAVFLAALVRALVAIRARQVALHREWMIRAFAIAIGISTVRVVAAAMDVVLTPLGVGPQSLFILSVWTGWAITLGAGELWIRHSRDRAPVVGRLTTKRSA